jgi:hypothetical protein
MKKVAAEMRELDGDNVMELMELADDLDPREPIAEADAAETFSQACEERKRS